MKQAMKSKIFQKIYDEILNENNQDHKILSKFKLRFFRKAFNYLNQKIDPLITYHISGFKLLFPFSHALPFIFKSHPNYSHNLPRIAKLVKDKYEKLTFIDIGANVGDSVALLREKAYFPILCIEADKKFFSILQQNISQFQNIDSVNIYLGEKKQNLQAKLRQEFGSAHLAKSSDSQDSILIEKLTEVLKTKPSFLKSKMIKIDTDGFDAKILRGAFDFLATVKPVIFFEYDPFLLSLQEDNGLSTLQDLYKLGYINLLIYENTGDFMMSATLDNTALLEEIDLYFSGHESRKYCDICVFHNEDSDLFERVRNAELEFFADLKYKNKNQEIFAQSNSKSK